jgi:type II restriction enzyme
MEFGFEEPQRSYDSGAQKARVWTERWVADWLFCPNCGSKSIHQLPANRPVADFYCAQCGDQYELKSQKKPFGAKVVDGAYKTMCERLESQNSPNFLLLQYDLPTTSVVNVCVIPKHFFVPEIIERRKPLPSTARRAGWIGCNILLDQVPDSGRIFVVRDRVPEPKESVLDKWKRTLFLIIYLT